MVNCSEICLNAAYWPHRLVVRTPGFHPGNSGSIPLGAAKLPICLVALEFKNVLRGQTGQNIVKILFEKAGYRVKRIGIEELCPDILPLTEKQYKALHIPQELRRMPDLIALDLDTDHLSSFLLEVKFRSVFTKKVMQDLHGLFCEQREYWPQTYFVILIADPFGRKDGSHDDHIRVVPGEHLQKLQAKCNTEQEIVAVWESLPGLRECFTRFEDAENAVNANTITMLISSLKELDLKRE